MGLSQTTRIECDLKGCKTVYEFSDRPDVLSPDGTEQVLRVTDVQGIQRVFCTAAHLAKWACDYSCPYKPDSAVLKPNGELKDEVLDAMTGDTV